MSSNETPPQPAGSQNETGDNANEGEKNAATGKKDTRAGIWADWAQIAGTFIAVIAVIVAISVAIQGQEALKTSTQTAERQSEDSQLSTAITEIGSGGPTGQITGLLLLAENASDRIMNKSATGETAAQVYTYYNSALQVLSSYLSTDQGSSPSYPSSGNGSGKMGLPFGRGYGIPPGDGSPLNIKTAADQLVFLLSPGTEKAVAALTVSRPSIVLSDDELAGREWQYPVNLGWITARLVSTDLRGADLASSQWSGTSDLSNSYLQCANLREANFRGADLAGADLRGADVQGADFIGANLNLAKVTQVYGTAKWPSGMHGIVAFPANEWNQAACMQDSQFWDNAPRAGTAPSKRGGKGTGTGGGPGSG